MCSLAVCGIIMRLRPTRRKVALSHHGRSPHDEGLLGGKLGHLNHEPGCHVGRIEAEVVYAV